MSLTNKTPSATYKDLLQMDNGNSGVDDTLRPIKDGFGDSSALYIEKNSIKVKPASDDTALLDVHDKDGNSHFKVDSSNDRVYALGHKVNTQYAYFGTNATDTVPTSNNTHWAIPFGLGAFAQNDVSLGTGDDPATTLAVSTIADDVVPMMWFIPDDITIDGVYAWLAGNSTDGDGLRLHLMTYNIVLTDGTSCGDLSSGVVVADGGTISHDGYEQMDFQSMTIQNADVARQNVCLFTLYSDGTNSDYALNITVKYHLR